MSDRLGQLSLFADEVDEADDAGEEHIDPFTCPFYAGRSLNDDVCIKNGRVLVNCRRSVAGDPPKCVYEPIDNSAEAVERRRKWIAEHGTGKPSSNRKGRAKWKY